MKIRHGRGDGVGHDGGLVAALESLARGLLDADLRHSAGDEQRFNVPGLQEVVEIGVVEGALAELLNDRVSWHWVDLVNNVRAIEFLADVFVVALAFQQQ